MFIEVNDIRYNALQINSYQIVNKEDEKKAVEITFLDDMVVEVGPYSEDEAFDVLNSIDEAVRVTRIHRPSSEEG